jgi:hypothetical protein
MKPTMSNIFFLFSVSLFPQAFDDAKVRPIASPVSTHYCTRFFQSTRIGNLNQPHEYPAFTPLSLALFDGDSDSDDSSSNSYHWLRHWLSLPLASVSIDMVTVG